MNRTIASYAVDGRVLGNHTGGSAFFLRAWHGEKMMGNLPEDPTTTRRGRLRAAMWQVELDGLPRVARSRDRVD